MEKTKVMEEREDDFDPCLQVTTLMNGAKFRKIFNQIRLTKEARIEATKAIIKDAEAQETYMVVSKGFVRQWRRKRTSLSLWLIER